jgi:urease accessory protein
MSAGLTMNGVALAAAALAVFPSTASAHTFVGNGGPAAGFMHPLTGLDHLLAMYALGLSSAQTGGRAIWTVPSAFVVVMLVGWTLAAVDVPLPGAELGVATSVVVLGASVAAGGRIRAWSALAAAGFFGLFHGIVHGAEMPLTPSPACMRSASPRRRSGYTCSAC